MISGSKIGLRRGHFVRGGRWCETINVLCLTLAIYYGKAYSIRDSLKTMGGGHAVHERQAILLGRARAIPILA